MIKYSSVFGLLGLIRLAACGQANHATISVADSLKVQRFATQSLFHQQTAPDSAIYFANQGLKLARRLHYGLGEALMLNRLSAVNSHYSNLKLAINYQERR